MKRTKLAAVLWMAGLFLSQCTSPSSDDGGGLFGGGGTTSSSKNTWDLIFMLEGATACPDGLPAQGAGMEGLAGGAGLPVLGYFPGIKVSDNGFEFSGRLPEVKLLTYFEAPFMFEPAAEAVELPPSLVQPGDTVNVRFTYMTQADGEDGDYFLVRIIDGSRFLTPAAVYGSKMAEGEPVQVNFQYTARSDGFGLEFIFGLSSPEDAVFLDDLRVRVAGQPLFEDNFEEGDYTIIQPVSPLALRVPLLPLQMAGTIAVQSGTALEGASSLAVTGGRVFQMYGQGASMDGFSGMILNYTAADFLSPFFGQSLAVKEGGMFVGDYFGTDNVTVPTCQELGAALISVNPTGNADLSGNWTLSVLAPCEEGGMIGEPTGEPTLYAAGFQVMRYLMLFMSEGPFQTLQGDSLNEIMGMSAGASAAMAIGWGEGGQAQLMGNFYQDQATGAYIYAGQLMGALPWGGQTCTISQGQFIAIIDKSGTWDER